MTQRSDVRSALLGLVPELTAPPDRLAEVQRRAARQRAAHLTRAVLVGVLALAAIGGSMRLLAVGGPSPLVAGPSASPSGPPWASASGADLPSRSASPSSSVPSVSPSATGEPNAPAYSGPLIGRDFCPRTIVLRGPIGVDEVPDRTGAPQVTHVTLCRYRNPGFVIGSEPASLLSGPRRADSTAVSSALLPILQPAASNNWNSEGCRYPSPQSNITVDIVYAIDIHGRAAAYMLVRIVCQNPWPQDPKIPLEQEVDRVMGPPY